MPLLPLYLANSFVEWSLQSHVCITPLKLQKLLYLYYARHLYLLHSPPFAPVFVKWPRGPVLPCLYERYQSYGATRILALLPDAQGLLLRAHIATEPFASIFAETLQHFGTKTARELVAITHHGPPSHPFATAWQRTPLMGAPLPLPAIEEDGHYAFATAIAA